MAEESTRFAEHRGEDLDGTRWVASAPLLHREPVLHHKDEPMVAVGVRIWASNCR